MPEPSPTRDELAEKYLEQLRFEPYPVQEEALLAWFTDEQGVLVCAPTGTGKTLIAEAALFEALHTDTVAYYTTPLIALTEQKFAEMQENAERWGFSRDDVGLVTGNRRVNPQARILVVVAEILLNRLLNPEGFAFDTVSAVVMDEFHSFNDPQRGIVWELSLSMLPPHVRLLLLSATVGNAFGFVQWLKKAHNRRVQLVEGDERRVPLTFQWVGDELVNEQITRMAEGDEASRLTPALLFCFNRDECWTVAEQLKGRPLMAEQQRSELIAEVNRRDWSQGVGPKLKQLLMRGVGVHHAGMLPKYRRVVEELYQKKWLAVCVCTETLASGINLPARSVVLTTLMKGPFGKKRIIDPSSAHQIFGRAGRPQFDDRGYVIVLAHEDDVKIQRWREKYDQIPDDTKDPGLRKAKKALKKKRPKHRDNQQYWNEAQFEKLKAAPPAELASRGPLPWRLLAYLLKLSPEVQRIRQVVHKRLMPPARIAEGEEALSRMLLQLAAGGYVKLEPEPPRPEEEAAAREQEAKEAQAAEPTSPTLDMFFHDHSASAHGAHRDRNKDQDDPSRKRPLYLPEFAHATETLDRLLAFKGVNPLYGAFLADHLGKANGAEQIQALESVLTMPRPLLKKLRVPPPSELPTGPLSCSLDEVLLKRGLITAPVSEPDPDDEKEETETVWTPPLADKLRLLFDSELPQVEGLTTQALWAAGELLEFGGDFDKFVRSHDLVKQEGIVFRHMLRLILLCGEFAEVVPPDATPEKWRADLRKLTDRLTESCHGVDPDSTDKVIEESQAVDALVRKPL